MNTWQLEDSAENVNNSAKMTRIHKICFSASMNRIPERLNTYHKQSELGQDRTGQDYNLKPLFITFTS